MDVLRYEKYVGLLGNPKTLEPYGQQIYRLLAQISTWCNHQMIIDISVDDGTNAYVLGYNQNNQVYSYSDKPKTFLNKVENVTYKNDNVLNEYQSNPNIILTSAIIFIDRNVTDAKNIYTLYEFLRDKGYNGLLVCDNIWSTKDMRDNFWSKIPVDIRYDMTNQGDPDGTCIITFKPNNKFKPYLPPQIISNNNDWTLVTAYINLTGYYDNTSQVRSKQFYIEHANGTMTLPYNLLVFCDKDSLQQLQSIRPVHLRSKTKYVVVDFDELKFIGHTGYENITFSIYRDKIIKNRKEHPYNFDPRNNASYYLFCMARYLFLKQAINDNPFNSTHFAWINICIERMGFHNLVHLDEALSEHRDKFSTCYIDYIPEKFIANTKKYFQNGICSMCSGFFTGQSKYMYQTCHAIESQFLSYLEQGYGHADEQLYSPVYFKYPQLFHHYFGDYYEMITNYCHIYDHPEKLLSIFIPHSFDEQNYLKCFECCQFLFNSYTEHKCSLTHSQLLQLCYYKDLCQTYISSHYEPKNKIEQSQPKVEQPQPTIISLLFNLNNQNRSNNIMCYANDWLDITYPVVIFTDDTYFQPLSNILGHKKNIMIWKRNINQYYPIKYQIQIEKLYNEYIVKNRDPKKDTVLYHMLMYSRPYMWKECIKTNPFNTKTFICMDFALGRFQKKITNIEHWQIDDKLKLLMINPFLASDGEDKNYFHITHHNIAGGLLTGSGSNIIKYVDLFTTELDQMVQNGWCQLDEALTACILRKYPELFDHYYGDYAGIISNYEKTIDLTNVEWIIQKYLDNRMYKEAQYVIHTIDYNYSQQHLMCYIKFSILTNYYTMNHQLSPIVIQLLNDPKNNEISKLIRNAHNKNLEFYENSKSIDSYLL